MAPTDMVVMHSHTPWSKGLYLPEPSSDEYLNYPGICRSSPDSELESSSIFLQRDSSVPDHLDQELDLDHVPTQDLDLLHFPELYETGDQEEPSTDGYDSKWGGDSVEPLVPTNRTIVHENSLRSSAVLPLILDNGTTHYIPCADYDSCQAVSVYHTEPTFGPALCPFEVEPCGHPLVECLPSEMSMTATEDMFCTAPELLEPLTSIHDKGPKAGYSCIAEEDVPLCPAFPVDRPARLKISRSARLAEAQQSSSGSKASSGKAEGSWEAPLKGHVLSPSLLSARGRGMKPRRLYGFEDEVDQGDREASRRRKHHNPWTLEETKSLVRGVELCGGGKWAEIKKLGDKTIQKRSAVDLKDKWRNLMRVALSSTRRAKCNKKREVPPELLSKVRTLAGFDERAPPQDAAGHRSSRSAIRLRRR